MTEVMHEFTDRKKFNIRQKIADAKRAPDRRKNCPEPRGGFDLDHEYILSIDTDVCPLLNIPIQWNSGQGTGTGVRTPPAPNSKSFDRINPHIGYERGNIQIVSHRANCLKSDATIDEWKTIYENWNRILTTQDEIIDEIIN